MSTAGYVKLLLPPRQSRGNSYWGLDGRALLSPDLWAIPACFGSRSVRRSAATQRGAVARNMFMPIVASDRYLPDRFHHREIFANSCSAANDPSAAEAERCERREAVTETWSVVLDRAVQDRPDCRDRAGHQSARHHQRRDHGADLLSSARGGDRNPRGCGSHSRERVALVPAADDPRSDRSFAPTLDHHLHQLFRG